MFLNNYSYEGKTWLRKLEIEILKREINDLREARGEKKIDWDSVIKLEPMVIKKMRKNR